MCCFKKGNDKLVITDFCKQAIVSHAITPNPLPDIYHIYQILDDTHRGLIQLSHFIKYIFRKLDLILLDAKLLPCLCLVVYSFFVQKLLRPKSYMSYTLFIHSLYTSHT